MTSEGLIRVKFTSGVGWWGLRDAPVVNSTWNCCRHFGTNKSELIKTLRDVAAECEDMERIRLCREAADRLEELDERVSVMAAEMDEQWGNQPG